MASIKDVLGNIAGVGSSVASAISPWASVLGGISSIGNLFGLGGKSDAEKAAEKQFEYQKYLQEQNLAMQRETNSQQLDMFNRNLDWQRESQQIQNSFNTEQWQKSFDATNAYNTPAAQMQRMINAGLNPMSVGQSTPALAGNNSSPSAGAGSSGSGIPNLSAPRYDIGQDTAEILSIQNKSNTARQLYDVSQALSALSNTNLSTAREKEIRDTLAYKIDNLIAQNDNIEVDTLQKKLENDLKSYFGFDEHNVQLELARQQISELIARVETERKQGNLFEAQSYLTKAEEDLTKLKNDFTSKEYHYLDEYLRLRNDNLRHDINVKKSEVTRNKASATESFEHARDLRLTRESRIAVNDSIQSLNKSIATLNETRNMFENQTLNSRVRQEFEKLSQMEIFTDEERQRLRTAIAEAEQAEYDNDMKKYTYWIDKGCQIVNTAASAVGQVKGFSFAPYTSQSSSEFQGTVDSKQHDYEEYETSGRRYYDEYGDVRQTPPVRHRRYTE